MTVVPKKPRAPLLGPRTRPREPRRSPQVRPCRRRPEWSQRSPAARPMARPSRVRLARIASFAARHGGRLARLRSQKTSRASRPAWPRKPSGSGAPMIRAAAMRTRPATRMASAARPMMGRPRGDPARAVPVRALPAMMRVRVRRAAPGPNRAAAAAAAVRPRAMPVARLDERVDWARGTGSRSGGRSPAGPSAAGARVAVADR